MQFRISSVLGLLGLVPVFFFTLWIVYHPHSQIALLDLYHYSIVVLSFLGGINWGLLTQAGSAGQNSCLRSYWALSVVPPIVAWLLLFFSVHWLGFLILAIMYILQYFVDVRLTKKNILPYWLLQLRRLLTGLMILGFIIVLIYIR
jgi:hypothetical protein